MLSFSVTRWNLNPLLHAKRITLKQSSLHIWWYSRVSLLSSLASQCPGGVLPHTGDSVIMTQGRCLPDVDRIPLVTQQTEGLSYHSDRYSASRDHKCMSHLANLSANGERADTLPGDFVVLLCPSWSTVPNLYKFVNTVSKWQYPNPPWNYYWKYFPVFWFKYEELIGAWRKLLA
jgi:hypothetical protein